MRRDGSISLGDAKIWRTMLEHHWLNNSEIAKAAGLSERTAQDFTKRYSALGLLDRRAECPAYFRISGSAETARIGHLNEALAVYGLALSSQRTAPRDHRPTTPQEEVT